MFTGKTLPKKSKENVIYLMFFIVIANKLQFRTKTIIILNVHQIIVLMLIWCTLLALVDLIGKTYEKRTDDPQS